MTNGDSIDGRIAPAWRQLANLEGETAGESSRQVADRVVEVAREVGVQPQQLDRIRATILEAFGRRKRGVDADWKSSPLRVQVWAWNVPISEQRGAGAHPKPCIRKEHCGWGFFVVEKQDDVPGAVGVESLLTIDLFLYRE